MLPPVTNILRSKRQHVMGRVADSPAVPRRAQHEVPKVSQPTRPTRHRAMASPQPHAKRGNAIGPLDRPGPSGGGAPLQYSTRTPPSNPSKQAQRHTRNGRSILSSPVLHAAQATGPHPQFPNPARKRRPRAPARPDHTARLTRPSRPEASPPVLRPRSRRRTLPLGFRRAGIAGDGLERGDGGGPGGRAAGGGLVHAAAACPGVLLPLHRPTLLLQVDQPPQVQPLLV